MDALLASVLARLTDRALAESMVGDLSQERHRRAEASRLRARLWFVGAGIALVGRTALARLSGTAGDLWLTRLGATGIAGEARQALRALWRTPVASGVIVATLAFGIGVNTAVFSVVYGVLFQPLPFAEPHRVVMIEGATGDRPPSIFGNSLEDFHDIRRDARTLTNLGAAGYWTFSLTDLEVPQRVVGAAVSGGFFETLGTTPVLGRWLTPDDDRPGAPMAVVIGHGLWRRVFGGRADIVGREIRPNGQPATIVGVMPASFRFPGEDVEVWMALRNEMDGTPRNVRFFAVAARLAPGVSREQASANVAAIAKQLEEKYPNTNRGWRATLVPALDALTTQARDGLLLLFAAVVMVFAVAVINVGGLLASRRAARSRELAVRVAVGATTPRLVRHALFESAWLGAAGLAFGVALAIPSVSLLRASAPASLPRAADIGLHWPVFALAAAAMLILIVVSGCAPILSGVLRRRGLAIREGGLAPAPTARIRAGSALVVVQIALAFVLLAGTALLVRSFVRVIAIDPGFRADHLVTMRVFLGPPVYRTVESQRLFADRALAALQQAPGVASAGLVSQPPFDTGGAGTSQRFVIEGKHYESGAQPSLNYRTADPRYLDTVSLPLKRGRWITAEDRTDSPRVIVVNEAMVTRFFPDADPIGARMSWPDSSAQGAVTIVGVVGNVATNGLERAESPAAYAPYAQRVLPFLRWMTFVARTVDHPGAVADSLRAAVQTVDPRQPIYAVRTMPEIVSESLAERRFSLLLMAAFAALTVGLAMLGLYGMLAQRVERRRREIGVRMSLGASSTGVFALVLRQGLLVVAVGLVLGIAASFALDTLVESLVFGITPGDGLARIAVAALICAVGTIACVIPARRASRVNPILALRNE